jgi:hypothetical protein
LTKKAKFKEAPPVGKHPVVASDPSSHHRQFPAWRVSILQVANSFGWHNATASELLMVRDRLAAFETMTWFEILIKAKHQNHHVNVTELCKDARDRLVALKQDDVDQLLSLRLTGAGRIWGMLEGPVMKILWWDPHHAICPSLKK